MALKRAGRRKLAPEIVAERQAVMSALQSVVQMLGGIVGPHVEVTLHQLSGPQDALAADQGLTVLSGGGRHLRAAKVVFRDRDGEPYAVVRVSADLSQFEVAHAWLGLLLQPLQQAGVLAADRPQMDLLMQDIIRDAVRLTGKPLAMMNKQEKIAAVRAMQHRGLFIAKGGVEQAAGALGVSRYTIYNYLEAVRQENDRTD